MGNTSASAENAGQRCNSALALIIGTTNHNNAFVIFHACFDLHLAFLESTEATMAGVVCKAE